MIALVELSPRGAPVAEDVLDPAAPDRNRGLLLYLRLRRHAQDLGWRAACREAADIATTEPGLVVSAAWRERWAAPVPRGLDSGRVPVAPEDELRRVDPAPPTLQASVQCDDAVALSLAMLRRQFRAWETMAALEERRAAARGAAALDLLYAEGAVLFHEREALYPAYASHTENDSRRPGPWRLGDGDSGTERECGWLRGVLSWELAASRFEELVRLDPSHALADDAAYSAALAHMKAADDRAVRAAGEPERDRHLRAGFAAFQELVELWPSSPFAASADAALRFWRKARKDLF
jgi:hypothetical protein